MFLRDSAQELYELGAQGAAFRVAWEIRTRLPRIAHAAPPPRGVAAGLSGDWTSHLPLEDPCTVAREMRGQIAPGALESLRRTADEAMDGRMVCFGRWAADFGRPIDWHRNPVTGQSWNAQVSWHDALADSGPGDVKFCWEAARFPHAYHMARAATFFPDRAETYAEALLAQICDFQAQNPFGRGIHWASGQEIGFRLLAWLFAIDVLLSRTEAGAGAVDVIAGALLQGASHIHRHLDFARIAVYNNHLLSEALALFAVGALLPLAPGARGWRARGRDILDVQAERQFYPDGAYIQQSHNYHRVALQDYLWACLFARSMGDSPSPVWLKALERSLDFLYAQQNPTDGRLPNYGANDGAMPSIVSTCDFSDMRPALQCVSLLVRGERLYEPGPWDESAAWFVGVRMLDAPLRTQPRASVAFTDTGYYVLRGADPSTFATFRCGTLRDRFSQIDMLHLDVWWNGQNVLVDAGSYRYNAADAWHEHFMRTACHNTVVVDGRDQMLHYRQFKVLYWTKARILRFADDPCLTMCEGEHYGYQRLPGQCVHRRAILHVKDALWIVIDQIRGEGAHSARLQWLGGPFPWIPIGDGGGMTMTTPAGEFSVRVFGEDGLPAATDVHAGVDLPIPRGWSSRYYGEKVPAPSLTATQSGVVPLTFVSILASGAVTVHASQRAWRVEHHDRSVSFREVDGRFTDVLVAE